MCSFQVKNRLIERLKLIFVKILGSTGPVSFIKHRCTLQNMSIIAHLYTHDDSCFLANSSISRHSINSKNIVLSLSTDLVFVP